ncbi:MAG TPA: hypothetical protein VFF06_31970 [Polyangia bacterium]|nr:hypothetical protein [Polyangia bacterium]
MESDDFQNIGDRPAQKARARQRDEHALARGEKSAEQLRRENGHFGFPPDRVLIRYDLAKPL